MHVHIDGIIDIHYSSVVRVCVYVCVCKCMCMCMCVCACVQVLVCMFMCAQGDEQIKISLMRYTVGRFVKP